jgi:hypothetical protein
MGYEGIPALLCVEVLSLGPVRGEDSLGLLLTADIAGTGGRESLASIFSSNAFLTLYFLSPLPRIGLAMACDLSFCSWRIVLYSPVGSLSYHASLHSVRKPFPCSCMLSLCARTFGSGSTSPPHFLSRSIRVYPSITLKVEERARGINMFYDCII